jgi:hypothetical protein
MTRPTRQQQEKRRSQCCVGPNRQRLAHIEWYSQSTHSANNRRTDGGAKANLAQRKTVLCTKIPCKMGYRDRARPPMRPPPCQSDNQHTHRGCVYTSWRTQSRKTPCPPTALAHRAAQAQQGTGLGFAPGKKTAGQSAQSCTCPAPLLANRAAHTQAVPHTATAETITATHNLGAHNRRRARRRASSLTQQTAQQTRSARRRARTGAGMKTKERSATLGAGDSQLMPAAQAGRQDAAPTGGAAHQTETPPSRTHHCSHGARDGLWRPLQQRHRLRGAPQQGAPCVRVH